ncbi:MAG: hypothetical protein ACD_3C00136G0005 [uncultured bacterium (gcode 4)]|uniref:Fibronectin type-III domain-containing protein n=1 Tax=uncultured bacterium (gcode 4) TaxID=1234023 RepID=K2GCA8_9BACT|nr:MAG: hypothetical protein ACD_3C00136G0005 [uncultured bacterium (gcode 4)]
MKISKNAKIIWIILMTAPFLTVFADRGGWRDEDNSWRWRGSDERLSSGNDDRWRGSADNSWRWRTWILRAQDEDKINRAFDRINNKLDFVRKVIDRIDKLIANINWSQMASDVKARKIAILEEIKLILQTRLQEFENIWDITPPVVSSLISSSISGSWANFSVNVNEAWKWYFVVLLNWSWVPTSAQVKAWTDNTWTTVNIKWNLNLVAWVNTFSVTGLTPSTSYVLFFTAEDNSGNLKTNVNSLNFATTASVSDVLPPTFSLSLSGVTNSWVTIAVNVNEAWKWYFVVLPNWSWIPTAAQIRSWVNSSGVTVSIKWDMNLVTWVNLVWVGWLTPNTSYIILFTAEDNSLNLQSIPVGIWFMTNQ